MSGVAAARVGRVHLVGAGPGDPELLTLKAARLLGTCDVVVYDRLAHPSLLERCRPEAERVYVGKERSRHTLPQAEISALLVARARAGLEVVRLKGGDPLVFGRGGEEIETLAAAGVPFEIVPGVTAALGCAAAVAIPLTHRDLARSLVIVAGHTQRGELELDLEALCRPGQTLVFYMGHKVLGSLCRKLVDGGLPTSLPAALIENGTMPGQRLVLGDLGTLPDRVAALAIDGPALVVVGEVAAFARLDLAARAAPADEGGSRG